MGEKPTFGQRIFTLAVIVLGYAQREEHRKSLLYLEHHKGYSDQFSTILPIPSLYILTLSLIAGGGSKRCASVTRRLSCIVV